MWIPVPASPWDQSIKKGLRKIGPGSSPEYSHAKTLGDHSRDDSLTHHFVDTVFSIMVSCYATISLEHAANPRHAGGDLGIITTLSSQCVVVFPLVPDDPIRAFFSKWQCKYNIKNLFNVNRCVDRLSRYIWWAQTHRLFFNQDCTHFLSRDIVGVSLPDYLFDHIPSKM